MHGSRSTGSKSIAFSRKIQTNTVSASGATSLRLSALWTMPLACVVDHLDQDLDRGLEAARHARGGLARGQPQQRSSRARRAAIEKNERIEIEDREVDQPLRLAGSADGSGGERCIHRRSGHVLLRPSLGSRCLLVRSFGCAPRAGRARAARTSTTACTAPSTPAAPARLTPGTIRDASTSIATDAAIFTISQPIMLTALTTGESDDSRLVVPRAIKRAGHDHHGRAVERRDRADPLPTTRPATTAATAPSTSWAAMTRHGERAGCRWREKLGFCARQRLEEAFSASSSKRPGRPLRSSPRDTASREGRGMATFSTAQDYTYKPARLRTPQVLAADARGAGTSAARRMPSSPKDHRPCRMNSAVASSSPASSPPASARARRRPSRPRITAATASRTTTSSSSPRAWAR